MRVQELASYRNEKNFSSPFYAELFCDDIWGDNGEDCASVTIHPTQEGWHLHYIRTQSGIPYPFAPHTSKIIDEYEKDVNDEQFYDYLLLHNLQEAFMDYIGAVTDKSKL